MHDPSNPPDRRTAADDAAYHRREAIRLGRLGERLHAAADAYAQAEIHVLLAAIAEAGERIPDFVRDNLPTAVLWIEGRDE
mgnify:CR=1 FL=1